jgi:hypothetical protein
MAEGKEFLLEVPVGASQVSEFKPNHPVKVVAYTRQGKTQESVLNFNAEGKATASFKFSAAPGPVKIALGPETVSAGELTNLQTISVDVPAASWDKARQVKLPSVAISSYYSKRENPRLCRGGSNSLTFPGVCPGFLFLNVGP